MINKPTTTQTKADLFNTAKELYDEAIKLQKQVSTLQSEKAALEKRAEKMPAANPASVQPTMQDKARDMQHVLQILTNLRAQFGTVNSGLSSKLIAKANDLQQLQAAIAEEKNLLQKIHALDTESVDLPTLLTGHIEETEKFEHELKERQSQSENELNALRTAWNKEQVVYAATLKERNEAQEKEIQREQDEYQYNFDQKKNQDQAEYAVEKERMQRELADTRDVKQTAWQAKEKEIADREKQYAEYAEKVSRLDSELDSAVKKAGEQAPTQIEREGAMAAQLRAKEIEGEKTLFEQKITALQSTLAAQEKRQNELTQQLNVVLKQAQDLAAKAIEGASNINSLAAVKEIAMEQAHGTPRSESRGK